MSPPAGYLSPLSSPKKREARVAFLERQSPPDKRAQVSRGKKRLAFTKEEQKEE